MAAVSEISLSQDAVLMLKRLAMLERATLPQGLQAPAQIVSEPLHQTESSATMAGIPATGLSRNGNADDTSQADSNTPQYAIYSPETDIPPKPKKSKRAKKKSVFSRPKFLRETKTSLVGTLVLRFIMLLLVLLIPAGLNLFFLLPATSENLKLAGSVTSLNQNIQQQRVSYANLAKSLEVDKTVLSRLQDKIPTAEDRYSAFHTLLQNIENRGGKILAYNKRVGVPSEPAAATAEVKEETATKILTATFMAGLPQPANSIDHLLTIVAPFDVWFTARQSILVDLPSIKVVEELISASEDNGHIKVNVALRLPSFTTDQ